MAAGLDPIIAAVEGLGVATRTELLQLCQTHGLGAADGLKLLKLLVKQNRVTRFQANALHHGLVKALLIGEYLVLDKLGSGGMGDVYKAQHRRLKRVVAIKLLPAAATRNPQMVRRFYREVEAVGKLIHPNIVTAYDAGEHNGVHYLVMEYVQGRDLGSVVKESGVSPTGPRAT